MSHSPPCCCHADAVAVIARRRLRHMPLLMSLRYAACRHAMMPATRADDADADAAPLICRCFFSLRQLPCLFAAALDILIRYTSIRRRLR